MPSDREQAAPTGLQRNRRRVSGLLRRVEQKNLIDWRCRCLTYAKENAASHVVYIQTQEQYARDRFLVLQYEEPIGIRFAVKIQVHQAHVING